MFTICRFTTPKMPHFPISLTGNNFSSSRITNISHTKIQELEITKTEKKLINFYATSKENQNLRLNITYAYLSKNSTDSSIKEANEIFEKYIKSTLNNYNLSNCLLLKLKCTCSYLAVEENIALKKITSKYFDNLSEQETKFKIEEIERQTNKFKEIILSKTNMDCSQINVTFFDLKLRSLQFYDSCINEHIKKKLNKIISEIQFEALQKPIPGFHSDRTKDFRTLW